MKAFLFSKGESTTELAKWSLERLGHEVVLLYDEKTTFYQKYLEFLNLARNEQVLIRMDADVIALKSLTRLVEFFTVQKELWWMTGKVYCYLRRDIVDAGVNIMNDKIISLGLQQFHQFGDESRPETRLSRTDALYRPRRFLATGFFVGLHGYKQKQSDVVRVLQQKVDRNQLKDWDLELVKKMEALPAPLLEEGVAKS